MRPILGGCIFLLFTPVLMLLSACRSTREVGEIEVVFRGGDGAEITVVRNGEIIADVLASSRPEQGSASEGSDHSCRYIYDLPTSKYHHFMTVRYDRLERAINDLASTDLPILTASEIRQHGEKPHAAMFLVDPDLMERLKPGATTGFLQNMFLVHDGNLEVTGVGNAGYLVGRARAKLAIHTCFSFRGRTAPSAPA